MEIILDNARTPLGASLDKVTEDLRDARSERLVILLTDGDETCGGDPAAAIEKLVNAGVRVNIVGFTIDDAKLAATLRHWSDVAGGMYFEAQDARGLDAAMTEATKAGFTIVGAQVAAPSDCFLPGERFLYGRDIPKAGLFLPGKRAGFRWLPRQ